MIMFLTAKSSWLIWAAELGDDDDWAAPSPAEAAALNWSEVDDEMADDDDDEADTCLVSLFCDAAVVAIAIAELISASLDPLAKFTNISILELYSLIRSVSFLHVSSNIMRFSSISVEFEVLNKHFFLEFCELI